LEEPAGYLREVFLMSHAEFLRNYQTRFGVALPDSETGPAGLESVDLLPQGGKDGVSRIG
jgi:hypothetical protein